MNSDNKYVYYSSTEIKKLLGRICFIDNQVMDEEVTLLYEIYDDEDMDVDVKISTLEKGFNCRFFNEDKKVIKKLFGSKIHTVDVIMGRSYTGNGCSKSREKVCINKLNSDNNENTKFLYLMSILGIKDVTQSLFVPSAREQMYSKSDIKMKEWVEKNKDYYDFLNNEYFVIPVKIKELSSPNFKAFRTCIMQYTCIVIKYVLIYYYKNTNDGV